MTEEQRNTEKQPVGHDQSSTASGERKDLVEAARDSIAKAKTLADEGINSIRRKFKEGGGVEGLMTKGAGFVGEVRDGFAPDEGSTGFKGFKSRVKNLWQSGKPGKITIVAIVIIILMNLGNLGWGDSEVIGRGDSKGSGATGISKKRGIAVKGFYIGMSVQDAADLINQKYLDVFGPLELKGFADMSQWTEAGQAAIKKYNAKPTPVKGEEGQAWWNFGKAIVANNSVLFGRQGGDDSVTTLLSLANLVEGTLTIDDGFEADEKGYIIKISFSPRTVNALFNVEDLSSGDFAQAFVDNYDIPLLEPNQREVEVNLWGKVQGGERYWSYTHPSGMRVVIWENKSILIERVASAAERKFD